MDIFYSNVDDLNGVVAESIHNQAKWRLLTSAWSIHNDQQPLRTIPDSWENKVLAIETLTFLSINFFMV